MVENLLELLIQPIALGEQIVELGLSQDAPERSLGELRRRVVKVLDRDDCLQRIHHAEEHHGVHLHRHVVARDDVLGRHVEDDRAQADPHDAIDGREDQHDARSFRLGQQFPEPEDDAAFVLAKNLDRAEDVEQHDQQKQGARAQAS